MTSHNLSLIRARKRDGFWIYGLLDEIPTLNQQYALIGACNVAIVGIYLLIKCIHNRLHGGYLENDIL